MSLLRKIDQVTFGWLCESPQFFENEATPRIGNTNECEPKTAELYRQFKVRFDFEVPPRKIRNI